jgi:CHAD domain-containing protein
LRYTLGFFGGILDQSADPFLDLNRRIQDHLGLLNDARVAVEMVEGMKRHREEAEFYADCRRADVARLMCEFRPIYAEFDRPEMRRDLAAALGDL